MTERGAGPRRALIQGFLERHPREAARLLEQRAAGEIVEILVRQREPQAAAVLEALSPGIAAEVVAALDDGASGRILPHLDPRRLAPLLARLDDDAREAKLRVLDRATARDIRALLAYPPESAGALMDPHVNAFPPDTTVRQALGRLRRAPRGRVLDVFVVDAEGRLEGALAIEELVLAAPSARLERLERRSGAASVLGVSSREEMAEIFEQNRLTTLPVVDLDGRLLGAVRYDTLMAVAEAEATASLQTMVGASREERALSRVSFAVRKRLPWLEINLVTAFLAAAVVGFFEATIAKYTALAVLLPVVAGQSGNTGAQAPAVTMRGLTLREIRLKDWARVALKEARVGLFTGVAVALTTGLVVFLWSGSVGLTLVILLSMVISMVAAALAGAVIPLGLSATGLDPAQSSSIVLTTVTDIVGFFSFLGIATLLASML